MYTRYMDARMITLNASCDRISEFPKYCAYGI